MKNRILAILVLLLILCLSAGVLISVNPYGSRPGSKRIESMFNQRTFYFPSSRITTEWNYIYSASEPAMVDSIIKTEATYNSAGMTTTVTKSAFTHSVQTDGNLTRTEYLEYRMPYNTLIGRYVFIYNQDNDLVELIAKHLSVPDSVHVYYHYSAPAKPDSMYYKTCSGNSTITFYFKIYYDNFGRLDYSVEYLNDFGNWYPYLKFTQNYGIKLFRYPAPLEYNDFRFYNVSLGGFEDSSIAYDKNYAPESITYEAWNWNGFWYPSDNYNYGVDVTGPNIALLSNRNNDYIGHFYYDRNGSYIGKFVYYTYLSDVYFDVIWDYYNPPETDENTSAPVLSGLSTYPNPFRASLNIKLDSKTPIDSDISIYNIKGQLIRSWKGVKSNELTWDGNDKDNKPVRSGVYLIKARQEKQVSTLKVIRF